MSTTRPRILMRLAYQDAAEAYLRSLPPEHFMEGKDQATQREISVESLALVRAARPDVQYFNELLLQYELPGQDQPGQVVPDNMVMKWDEPLEVNGSYDLPFMPVGPLCVLEYVSKSSRRKDYDDNFRKYEQEVKVPYYLLFYPQTRDLTLYRHDGVKYVTVKANENGRHPIPELELEVGLLDGWVRYWFRGELLRLPAELDWALQEANRRAREEGVRREQAEARAQDADRRAEEQARRAEEQTRRAEEQTRRAEEQARRAQDADRRAEEQALRAEEERLARAALEQRLAQLEAQLAQRPPTQQQSDA